MNKDASRKSRFLSPGWLMFGSALLCVVLVPVVHAAMHYSSEKSERQRQLVEMTESERLKTQHAFAEFQKLSPEQQESFRELDRRLNQEDIKLKTTLADYQEFLSSLSPVDRVEIDRAATQRERLNAIQQIQAERAARQQQLDTGYSMIEQYRSEHSRQRGEVFSPKEIILLAKLIEDRLPTDAKQKVKLDSQVDTVRFALTVAAALDAWGGKNSAPKRELFEEDLMKDLFAAIQNEDIRKDIERHPRKDMKFLDFSFRTVMREQWESAPETSVLYQFLESRDSAEKEKLMAKDPRWMYFELARKYAEVNPTDLSLALELMRKEAGPFHERMRGRSGRGPDGRGGGPDGRGPGGRDGEKSSREESGSFRRDRGPRDGGFEGRSENRDRSSGAE